MMSVSDELEPDRLDRPVNRPIAELVLSRWTEKPRVEAYWSAARTQRYHEDTTTGSSTISMKDISTPK